jgi:hypothetical protein
VAENYRDNTLGFRLNWKLYQIFQAPAQALFGHDRFSGDFNGDGFSDMLVFDRSTGNWWLGKTLQDTNGNSSIDFQMWSTMPFYSSRPRISRAGYRAILTATENRYRVLLSLITSSGSARQPQTDFVIAYTMTSYGPDSARVMATPLPQDEVQIKENTVYQHPVARQQRLTRCRIPLMATLQNFGKFHL